MGKKARPVVVIGDSDLVDNGGQYELLGQVAMRVSGDDTSEVMGGYPSVVYPVTEAQVQSGEFSVLGGKPVYMAQVSGRGQETTKYAVPVYSVNEWPS